MSLFKFTDMKNLSDFEWNIFIHLIHTSMDTMKGFKIHHFLSHE